MADVFLSYKREDAAKVRKLVAALRAAGLDCWWDEDIPPSAPWEATIEKELARAKAVIVCWSPDAVASENVRSEARVAREDGRLIQVFLKPCNPPLFFGERQGLDLSKWRGNADDPRIAKLAETARRVAAGERAEGGERPKQRRPFDLRLAGAIAALLLLVIGAGFGWWWFGPAKADGPQTVAVLPFRAINASDANLVDAIWDDTRGAISRNPNLRVLGRQAVEALSKKDFEPKDYREKLGVDYLLDGNVQRAGDTILMNVSLTRTSDETQVWSGRIGGKLDDVFAFQARIASEVEGRLRGRIAPGGGIKAQNIATTGEVYAIYADARALVLKRGDGHGAMGQARELIEKALAIDPNYAPAWAELGVANGIGADQQHMEEAISNLNRALQLAPNLAHAHAALAMVQNCVGDSINQLRKAVQIDPNDAEAWMWLCNCYNSANRMDEAISAYSRAVEIEPLWLPAIANKIGALAAVNDTRGIESEIRRVASLGDPALLAKLKAGAALAAGHPGDAVRMLLDLRLREGDQTGWADNHLWPRLLQLGFVDEVAIITEMAPDAAAAYRGTPEPPGFIRAVYKRPVDFWQDGDAPSLMGRLLSKNGRVREYADLYHATFRNVAEFDAAFALRPQVRSIIIPTIAVNLRAAGDAATADALLARADNTVSELLRNGPPQPDLLMRMAHVRAAEQRDDEAMSLLSRAVAGGWLPDRSFYAVDIADEPVFARLTSRPQFEASRQHVLARIEEERHKVPLSLLAQAYPRRGKVAA
jgi:TolB-like protein/Flp pilus assembly protein TadD